VVWALLPVKDLVKAKSRLAGILAPHERRALAQAMVEDVLGALVASPDLEGVMLVSDDPGAGMLAQKYGVLSVNESTLGCQGMNAVIGAGCELLRERGADAIMVVHSDLPLLQERDVAQLLSCFEQHQGLVLAPDLAEDGTNIMLFASASRPRLQYGPASCRAHIEAAQSAGLQVHKVKLDTAGLDIDEPSDLLSLYARLKAGERAEHTARLLLEGKLQQRLSVLEDDGMQHEFGTGT